MPWGSKRIRLPFRLSRTRCPEAAREHPSRQWGRQGRFVVSAAATSWRRYLGLNRCPQTSRGNFPAPPGAESRTLPIGFRPANGCSIRSRTRDGGGANFLSAPRFSSALRCTPTRHARMESVAVALAVRGRTCSARTSRDASDLSSKSLKGQMSRTAALWQRPNRSVHCVPWRVCALY